MSDIQLTRLPGYDKNGNPRYVCHYLNLLTEAEKTRQMYADKDIWQVYDGMTQGYHIAVARAHKIGGRKYHTKAYGGGIVFTDYENVIREHIKRVVAEAEEQEAK